MNSPIAPRLNRRTLIAFGSGLASTTLLARYAAAQNDPAVDALINQATTAMAGLSSFHFVMTTIDGTATILGALELSGAAGDVVRPDKLQAQLSAKAAITTISIDVVAIGADVWITNPLQAGAWEQVSTGDEQSDQAASTLVNLVSPDALFLLALKVLKGPVIDGTESLDGVDTTKIVGEFSPVDLVSLLASSTPTSGTPEADELTGILTDQPITLTFWIGADGKVYQIDAEGPLTKSESRDVYRRFVISNFNVPVDIEPPI